MLNEIHQKAQIDALAHFGLTKEAAGFWQEAKRMAIGEPRKLMQEGFKTFRPGGLLSTENVWWPKTKGLPWKHQIMPWLQRLGTLSMPFTMYHAYKNSDPEHRAENVLGMAGSQVGNLYGMSGLGMVGGMLGAPLGQAVGQGIGRLIDGPSKPREPRQEQYAPSIPSVAYNPY